MLGTLRAEPAFSSALTTEVMDQEEVRRALLLLADPEAGLELRGITPQLPRGFVRSRVRASKDIDRLMADALELSTHRALYFTINPVLPTMTGSASAADVLRRRWLPLDIDPVRPEPTKTDATDSEHAAALYLVNDVAHDLREEDWPDPVTADSGNGTYGLYRIELPNDGVSYALVHAILLRLANRFDTPFATIETSVHNADRILKLPGTWSRKGPGGEDRPHRLSRLLTVPPTIEVVPEELLYRLAGIDPKGDVVEQAKAVEANYRRRKREAMKPPGQRERTQSTTAPTATCEPKKGGLQPLRATSGADARTRAIAYLREIDTAISGQHGSNPTMWAARVVVWGYDFGVEEGLRLLLDHYNPRCVPPWNEADLLHKCNDANEQGNFDKPRGWLLDVARASKAPIEANGTAPPKPQPASTADLDRIIIRGSEVTPRAVEWLWPDRIPLGKLTTFAGLGGLGKCVVGGTLILTECGMVPIESLRPNDAADGAMPLKVKVMTPDGMVETSHFYVGGRKPTIRLQTRMGYAIQGTHVHPILCLSPRGTIEWKKMADMRAGDYVAVQQDSNSRRCWTKISRVSNGREQEVFDLAVPGPHAFVTNGIVSHNTFVLLDMTARVTKGECWPDGGGELQQVGQVLFISGEDDPDDTLVPRLQEMGADLDRVTFLTTEAQDRFTLADLPMIERALRETGDGVRLLVIDPPTAYLGDVDDHKNAELRGLLSPLRNLAAQWRLACVFNTHLNKQSAKIDAMMRVMGSVAWVNAVRAAHLFARDSDDPAKRLFIPMKNNLGPEKKGLAYKIALTKALAKVEWLGEVDMSADQAVNHEPTKPRRVVASEWLVERFREKLEWKADDLMAAARAENIGRDAIFEAKRRLNLPKARKVTSPSGDVCWTWAVPADWPPLQQEAPDK